MLRSLLEKAGNIQGKMGSQTEDFYKRKHCKQMLKTDILDAILSCVKIAVHNLKL